MADIDTRVDPSAIHDAIVADLKAKFPQFQTVQFYRGAEQGERSSLPIPALLLDCDNFEISEDNLGTEQLSTDWSFEVRIVISDIRADRGRFAIRSLAATVAQYIHLRRWRIPGDPDGKCYPTGQARVTQAERDDYDPSLDKFLVWRIDWQQNMSIGDNVWIDPDAMRPEVLHIGITPDIGPGNEGKYWTITPEDPNSGEV